MIGKPIILKIQIRCIDGVDVYRITDSPERDFCIEYIFILSELFEFDLAPTRQTLSDVTFRKKVGLSVARYDSHVRLHFDLRLGKKIIFFRIYHTQKLAIGLSQTYINFYSENDSWSGIDSS